MCAASLSKVRSKERQFHSAARQGDIDGLRALLSASVVTYSDGGGRATAARKPVVGPDHVARLFVGLAKKYPEAFASARIMDINGRPALLLRLIDVTHVIGIDVEEGRIRHVYNVANPDKLVHLKQQLAAREGGH